MTAYDETPVSVHKFVPLVSLGEERDKYIPWGMTQPDAQGNYYYTSFSPALFVTAWAFFKLTGLPVGEEGLYCLSTLLLFMTCIAYWAVFRVCFGRKIQYGLLSVLFLLMIFSPEVIHSTGLTYWAQSLMQILLPLQFICYKKRDESCAFFCGFLFLCALLPYVEWTGYVSDMGYLLVFLYSWKKRKELATRYWFRRVFVSGCIGLGIFCLHYLTVLTPYAFFRALALRFLARSTAASGSILDLCRSEWISFWPLWLMAIGALLFLWRQRIHLSSSMRVNLFLLGFPVLENIVMKEHAIEYTYDHLKIALPLMFFCYMVFSSVWSKEKLFRRGCAVLSIFLAIVGMLGYRAGSYYQWPCLYRASNEALAQEIQKKYPDSVMGLEKDGVRGYVNLLFRRGIYENIRDIYFLEEKAKSQGVDTIVLLKKQNEIQRGKHVDAWNMYHLKADIYHFDGEKVDWQRELQ